MGTSKEMYNLFTRLSHHSSLSIIFTTQNFYFSAKNGVTIRRNLSERILFYHKNDMQGIRGISEYTLFLKKLLPITITRFRVQTGGYLEKIDAMSINKKPNLLSKQTWALARRSFPLSQWRCHCCCGYPLPALAWRAGQAGLWRTASWRTAVEERIPEIILRIFINL